MLEWNMTKYDMCRIWTSTCGVYEIVESYEGQEFSLHKWDVFQMCADTVVECKNQANWDNKHN